MYRDSDQEYKGRKREVRGGRDGEGEVRGEEKRRERRGNKGER